jgi:hypothetical protein
MVMQDCVSITICGTINLSPRPQERQDCHILKVQRPDIGSNGMKAKFPPLLKCSSISLLGFPPALVFLFA